MKRITLVLLSAVVAGLATSAALAQDPIVPPPGVEPANVWPQSGSKTGKFDLAFYVETLPGTGGARCINTSRIARGERVVWHIGAVNARTGEFVGTKQVKYAYIKVPGVNRNIGVTFVPHGRDPATAYWTWTGRWDVPADYPLGAVDYTIVFKLKGWPKNKVATFKQLPLGGSTLTVIPSR